MKHFFNYVFLVQPSSHLRTTNPNLGLIYLHKNYVFYMSNWGVETEDGLKGSECIGVEFLMF